MSAGLTGEAEIRVARASVRCPGARQRTSAVRAPSPSPTGLRPDALPPKEGWRCHTGPWQWTCAWTGMQHPPCVWVGGWVGGFQRRATTFGKAPGCGCELTAVPTICGITAPVASTALPAPTGASRAFTPTTAKFEGGLGDDSLHNSSQVGLVTYHIPPERNPNVDGALWYQQLEEVPNASIQNGLSARPMRGSTMSWLGHGVFTLTGART